MGDKNYEGLRKSLIAILGDLQRAKKNGEKALRSAKKIGGPLQKRTAMLGEKFDKLAHAVLQLEQETREI